MFYINIFKYFIYLFIYLLIATRETAFVHAISAAGVMYTLTKNCSLGDFDNCGCDESKIGKTGKTFSFILLTMRMYN